MANSTGVRVLAAIGNAVPVRLMKRDLLFVAERLAALLDEGRLAILARQHGIKKAKDNDSIEKLFLAALRRADEGTLGRVLVEGSILLLASRKQPSQVLKEVATAYKVDTDAIALKVKQEFATRRKPERNPNPPTKSVVKVKRAA
jgi:ParB family transcriptional regulator, chromosome partitioning protein